MNSLSVVIPTYNRCETLQKAIAGYLNQVDFRLISEILVVDDGSNDSTETSVRQLSLQSPIPIRYFRQENRGPAAARNVGIHEAKGKIILFTDDDIIPSPNLISEHLNWHVKFPQLSTAVLGYVTWSPDVGPTPFMKWYGLESLFSYARLAQVAEADYRTFYTCNVSLNREFLLGNGLFDEDFTVAAFEDIELAFRLSLAGMRLLYNAKALAYHHQYISFSDACRRYTKAAEAKKIFIQKEAGEHFYSSLKSNGPSRLKKKFGKEIRAALSPLKRLMDSRVPLPWSMYRMMFRVYR